MRRSHLVQNILNPKKVECLWFSSSEVVEVAEWVDRLKAQFVAVAVALSSRGQVVAIAFATPTEVAHISWDVANSTQRPLDRSCVQNIFRAPRKTFVAFDMAHIILLLRETFGCQLTGVDLSTLGQPDDGHPQSPGSFIASSLSGGIQQRDVHNIWERLRTDEEKYLKLAYQAWITAIGAKASRKLLPSAIRLSSAIVPDNLASILGSLVQSTWLLREHVKLENDGEITEAKWNEKGEITLFNARYKSRVRKSRNTTIELMMEDGFRLVGKAVTVREKITILEPLDGDQFAQPGARIEEVTVLGREEATSSERARDVLLRRLLQGDFKLQDSNFICRIWDPSTQVPNAPTLPTLAAPLSRQGLNNSQYRVVNAMLSSHPRDSLVIVHGPPGTGKTTTIARAAREWVAQGESVWITAQKNVAVKNIATSLVKLGVDFRLLVSPEFYYGWHEHLYYDAIRDRTIVTEILSSDPVAIRELLGSVYVILCPISMLSNPVLDNCGAYQIHPVKNLVVDEASQIQAFEYLPVFHKMRDTLQKACFFGDPKQLPPYGHEFAQLQSVFDVRHLKKSSYLLDTQYRMPARLGQFLSDHVYEKKLISHRKDSSTGCVTFVDVASGQEEQEGTSWKNMEEAKIAISVVRAYYHDKEFAIITPYDPQRAEIARLLKMAGLPDKVFTVDSFQGHEADFIIASSVRTEKTGFLSSQFRMNVMLSRCKCGMVLVTNRAFIENPRTGAKTLLGRLAGHWQSFAGTYGPWVSKESVEAQEADLPGVRGPNRPLEALVTPVSPRDQRTVLPRATRTGPSSSYPTPISAGQSGAQLQGRWKQGFVPQTAPVLAPTRPHISRAQRPATDGYLRDPQDFPSLPLTEDDECFSRPRLQGRWEQGPSVSPGAAGSALARPIPTAESCWPF